MPIAPRILRQDTSYWKDWLQPEISPDDTRADEFHAAEMVNQVREGQHHNIRNSLNPS